MDLRSCVPQDKFDLAAIPRARAAGFPAINPILPELLEWLQDINYPVAGQMVELLSGSGSEIVPHIRRVLVSDDSIWKYWVLSRLCSRLAPAVLVQLIPDITRLADQPSEDDMADEVDVEARSLLASL
ncbi:DUF5071 domain-containing protein [Sulfitobacter porphyrae]|uniref:DUF5071 domain-containing protein n=1 Tax=Sulfitobacter porphyrae TaxID=1246864 RepID=A0ABW2B2J8_9RHOB